MRLTPFVLILFATLLAGCARLIESSMSDPILRPAENTPARFVRVDAAGTPRPDPTVGDFCYSPLLDPRDGTRITLERSAQGFGDYDVKGAYGAREREYLRIRCSSGEPVGIVAR